MKIELLVIIITIFLVYNTYHDGKYSKLFHINKKYLQMAMYAFVGLSLYLFIKRNPKGAGGMLTHANNIIKYMPIDKNTSDMLTPLFDFTSTNQNINSLYNQQVGGYIPPQTKRMMNSGLNTSKRSVSETKKKYVAAQQNWKCFKCNQQLKATFEVDHRIELRYGGTNHISNLEALCVECHKDKTMQSNL